MDEKTGNVSVYLAIFVFIAILIIIPVAFKDHLTFENLEESKTELREFTDENYILAFVVLFLACALVTNSPIPLATIVKFSVGYVYGFTFGFIINLVASFVGCMAGFYIVRYFFRERFQKKYSNKLKNTNEEIKNNAFFYFFLLRVTGLFPYFLTNILGGISKVHGRTFGYATFLGLIPLSALYAYGGTKLNDIESLKDILSVEVLLFFIVFILIISRMHKFKKDFEKRRAARQKA